MKGEINSYDPSNLFDYINGAADLYLKYDFQKLDQMIYESGEKSVIIEIYNHLNSDNAFGIYSQERPLVGKYINFGAQGYYEEGTLNFLKGSRYIKIIGYNLGGQDSIILFNAASKTDAILSGDSNLPSELSVFPSEGKIVNSEQFINENFLGYSFLTKAYTADYNLDDESFKMFLIKIETESQGENIIKDYCAAINDQANLSYDGIRILSDPYHGKIYLRVASGAICGISGTNNDERAKSCLMNILEP